MPYDTKVLKQKAIEAIKKNKLIFIEDVCAMIGIAKSTYYDHFKEGSDDSNELNTLLNENKISLKVSLRKKWFDSDNATTQLALYKLCSEPDELKRLSTSHVDMTTNGKDINAKKMTDEEIQEEIERLKKVEETNK